MKSYAIYDEELNRTSAIGYLFYYEKAESFIIELCKDLDEWDAPILFQGLVRKGIYTVSRDISFLWVKERVIPSGRQNIGSILKNHKLKEYSEMALLSLSKGRCSQDNCYIAEVSEAELPEEIKDRMKQNVLECFPTEDKQLVCMFKDNTVRMINLAKLADKCKDVIYVLKNKIILDSILAGHPITGAESVVMGDFKVSGLQAVNSLCENLQVNVYRDGMKFTQDYVRGVAQHGIICVEEEHESGMEMILKPDKVIFGDCRF